MMLSTASRIQLININIWTNNIENNENISIYLLAVISAAKLSKLKSLIADSTLLDCYKEYTDIFLKDLINQLSENKLYNHTIDLKLGKTVLYESLYNLSKIKLVMLQDYIDTNLLNNFIKLFKLSAKALILFVKKKDDTLRLCVDYKDLNLIIIKNYYLLSLISKFLNYLRWAKIFTKLDLMSAYYYIQIKSDDEWKTAFKT